jgi:hypothetical protein
MISKLKGKGMRSSEETKEALKRSSSVKLGKYLRAKTQNIL